MKNAKPFIATSLLLLVLFGLISSHCTPETGGLVPSTEEVLVRNVWSVDYYYHDQDMTSNFSSSRLLFSTTGVVGYQKNNETIAGTWSKTMDASNIELITLHFNTSDAAITSLNESWRLTSRSANSILFEETSGANILFRIKTQ